MLLTNRSSSPITLTSLALQRRRGGRLLAGRRPTPAPRRWCWRASTQLHAGRPLQSAAPQARATPPDDHPQRRGQPADGRPPRHGDAGTAGPDRAELERRHLCRHAARRAPRRRRSRCTTAATSPSTSAPSRSAARTRPTSSASGTCAVGTPLPIAADCTVILTFAPDALGLRTATLSIASDASNGTAVIALSGTGVPIPAPQVSLTPATLDFGTQTIGGLYPARRIRLANSGTADLTVGSIAASGAGFAIAALHLPRRARPGGRLRHRHRVRTDRGPGLHRRADAWRATPPARRTPRCCAAAAASRRSRCWCSRRRSRSSTSARSRPARCRRRRRSRCSTRARAARR